jgi:hypothetical protein
VGDLSRNGYALAIGRDLHGAVVRMADLQGTGCHNVRVCEPPRVCWVSTISAAASHAGTVPSWVVDALVLVTFNMAF